MTQGNLVKQSMYHNLVLITRHLFKWTLWRVHQFTKVFMLIKLIFSHRKWRTLLASFGLQLIDSFSFWPTLRRNFIRVFVFIFRWLNLWNTTPFNLFRLRQKVIGIGNWFPLEQEMVRVKSFRFVEIVNKTEPRQIDSEI